MERPIIFSAEMVSAILASRKTQTRRVITPQPVMDGSGMWQWKDCQWMDGGHGFPRSGIWDYAPYKPDDVLWVRETWAMISDWTDVDPDTGIPDGYIYKAGWGDGEHPKWRPSIHMPRAAERIFLRVTDVRVERLQDITINDAKAEGDGFMWNPKTAKIICEHVKTKNAFIAHYAGLWDSLNAKRGYGWDTNPWVWVYEFERADICLS